MDEMLHRQTEIELDFDSHIETLNQHLLRLDDLRHYFVQFQHSFRKLLIEVARRRHYKEAADQIVRGMMSQLAALAEGAR